MHTNELGILVCREAWHTEYTTSFPVSAEVKVLVSMVKVSMAG